MPFRVVIPTSASLSSAMNGSESGSIEEERKEDADEPDDERRWDEVGMEASDRMRNVSSSLASDDLRA